MQFKLLLYIVLWSMPWLCFAQQEARFTYKVGTSALVGDGHVAPLWFTANRYGIFSSNSDQILLNSGLQYQQKLKRHWEIESGLELVGGNHLTSKIWIQQAYFDVKWKNFNLSIGSKERIGTPLEKNILLTSGWMVEGPNARPIPQVRGEIKDYLSIPGTGQWLAFKGHIGYGWFVDGNWQENFVAQNREFTKDVLYHSKSLMLRLGKRNSLPIELELGIMTAAQFGGKRFKKQEDGSALLVRNMPHGLKEYLSILIPKQKNTIDNVSGNHTGSWNMAINTYWNDWRITAYLEHYFEDHSQMFWQYGRWKDGQLGFEIVPAKNRWISAIVWEVMSTKDQTKSVLYDGVGGSYDDIQYSGCDHYYYHGEYLSWQNYGSTLGHPFLYGPQYNLDGSIEVKSSRVRSQHVGLLGNPTDTWNWRILASFVRHWGTYYKPLDKQRKQFSGLFEINYHPTWAKGWSFTTSLGIDRGNYLGNNTGGMLSLRKVGNFTL